MLLPAFGHLVNMITINEGPLHCRLMYSSLLDNNQINVRMAERSKAPDSRYIILALFYRVEYSGPRMWAWVQIPLLTKIL